MSQLEFDTKPIRICIEETICVCVVRNCVQYECTLHTKIERETETAEPQLNETRQSTFMNRSKQVSYKNMLMANGSINAVP